MSISVGASASGPGYSSGSISVSDTSAMPVGLRSRVPAKITSSMREPRRVLADCSRSTHEMASAIFDLPQPLGPMMAATPSPWNLSSVRSQNDLNPRIWSFFSLSNLDSLENQWPVVGGQLSVGAGCPIFRVPCEKWVLYHTKDHAGRAVYQTDSSPAENDACSDQCRPRLDRAGTNLSYCNGEIVPGSSNITLYIVWPCGRARWVAHTLQQMPGLRVREGRGRKNRESKISLVESRARSNLSCASWNPPDTEYRARVPRRARQIASRSGF